MFEVIVTSANKTVATQAAADALVIQIQNVFGIETRIQVVEVKKTYDGKTAGAIEVGTVRTVVAEYPPKAV